MELSPCWTEIVDVELIAETERFKKEGLVLTKLHDEAQFAETLKNFLAPSSLFFCPSRTQQSTKNSQ